MIQNANIKSSFDLKLIRDQFPILHQEVNGKDLVYFDNAATTQKPKRVIEALNKYYEVDNANIHRGAHALADRSTRYFEHTRASICQFINSPSEDQIIFTKGTTDGINLVAATFGRANIKKGDSIIISHMEHHSNIVPWQMLCEATGATLKVIKVTASGELDMNSFDELLDKSVKLVSIVHASNALGTINPVEEIIQKAHQIGAKVLLDGAQSASHLLVDVHALDCDFYVCSAHKLYGPTGVGFLYGKRELLEEMPPYQGGGEMIKEVDFAGTTYNTIPFKFEAGTPNIGDVIAFNEAIQFINELGKDAIMSHENELLAYATEGMESIPGVRLIGTAAKKVSVLSFLIEGMHPFDVGMMLDARGIAVRTGHHCTQPLMKLFNIEGTVRASFAVYNTKNEIDTLLEGVAKLAKMKQSV
ncbi:aminotransferase class V-fold PLP-dependent enzyme [Penaeicola halotolerans]|uniref:aminotransferase class V-fold PLP-dependent enzyme n=1 Tax=Penaeicola halotolerans TaxID=2793196 RepID=UPI001CF851AB|nr:cysteine desulfurase [Penaeicola halotolerans]